MAAMTSAAETLRSRLEFVLDERAGALTPEQRRFLDGAVRYGERLVRLAEDMHTVALAESGELETSPQGFDLVEVAREAVEQVWPVAHVEGKPIELRHDEPVWIEADKKWISRTVLELLNDVLDVASSGNQVRVSVVSTGLEVAYTGDELPAESSLALAEAMARLHGGELIVCDAGGAVSLALMFEPAPVALHAVA